MDSYNSYVKVEKLPSHLSAWMESADELHKPVKQSINQSVNYYFGIVIGLIVSLSVALPASLVNQSINQSFSQSVLYNSSVYRPTFISTNHTLHQSINQSVGQSFYQSINQNDYHSVGRNDVSIALEMIDTMSKSVLYQSISQYLTFSNWLVFLSFLGFVYLYKIINRPLVFSRPLSNEARMTALQRSYPDMPPPFPNAWFRLCSDFDLNRPIHQPINQSINQSTNEQGYEPFVIDAFDHQFTVERSINQSISCIDESGREWEVCEVNRVVFIWHDVNNRASSWQVPPVSFKAATQSISQSVNQPINQSINQPVIESDSAEWQFVGSTSHEIMSHICEIPENGADTAHLDYLHGSFVLDWLTGNAAAHTWDASWQPAAHPNCHHAHIKIDTAIKVFGYMVPGSTVKTRITQVGPGIVQLLFPIPHFGNVLLQETITPIHANLQRATHVMYCQNTVPKPIAKIIMKSTLIQFERDFIVWNSKRWIRSPLAVKEDGPILKYRRWMKQFFDEAGGELIRDYEGQSRFVSKMKH